MRASSFFRSYQTLFVLALCLLGAVRVFLFSAAFPFFNNVDEQAHLDLVVKYSLGHVPRTLEQFAPQSAALIARYFSPEFFFTPERAREQGYAPLWKDHEREETIAVVAEQVHALPNFESSQPPLYYFVAGLWFDVGRALGISGGHLLYWIRFLNALLLAALVWLGFLAARAITDNSHLSLAVPLLIAFIPQDAFFAIENDNLSAVVGAAGFLLLVPWLKPAPVPCLVTLMTGICLAAVYLTKLANLPFLVVGLVAILVRPALDPNRKIAPAVICCLSALLPIGFWLWWCNTQFGDLTGTSAKIASLTWTQKPISQWLSHPIFTPQGLWIFLSQLLARFWRGEFIWHEQPLAWAPADAFYAISSLVFPIVAVIPGCGTASPLYKRSLLLAGLICLASIAFLALLSLQFDFGQCPYPSNEFPYFTSGRLMLAGLVPFAILYVEGIARVLRWLHAPVSPLIVIGTIIVFVTATEIALTGKVFGSVYNWFHL